MLESDEDRIVQTPTQARAGVTGHRVRHVLVGSLIGAILVMIVIAALTFN
jgi:acid phosphatase family membrane protein YuiD